MKKEIQMILKLKISDEEKASLIDLLTSKQNIIYIDRYVPQQITPNLTPPYYPINYCGTSGTSTCNTFTNSVN